MILADFKDFQSDVILVVGGCDQDIEPTIMDVREIFPEAPSVRCCVIQTKFDNWEYTGFHMLHIYKDHPLVFSDRYLTIHDTCTVGADFVTKYNNCKVWQPPEPNKKAWIFSVQGIKVSRLSNIYLFSRRVVLNYNDNFKTKLTKGEAVDVEGRKTIKGVRPLIHFGESFGAPTPRQIFMPKDIYDTGYPRLPHWFPVFGVTKWVLLHWYGDFTEQEIKLNFPNRGKKRRPK